MKNFNHLYQKYADDVFRFALYLCGSVEWAEDLASETIVRAWMRRNSLRMPTVKGYLLVIVHNLYRRQMHHEQRFSRLDEHIPDRTTSPEAGAEQRAELRMVLRGLQTLPENDRAALLMRALHDMPYQEIAAALDISLSAARVKVHRARLKLVEIRQQEMNGDNNDGNDP